MSTAFRTLITRLRSNRGQGLVEYALIISVVGLGTIAALTFLRDDIRGLFSRAGSSVRLADSLGPGGGGNPGGNGPPPAASTPVNSGTPGSGGLPPAGPAGTNDNPIWLDGTGDGPAGFQNAPGVYYGDFDDPPPTSHPVTVTELGIDITVRGCSFTLNGFTFHGVWLREPTATIAGDWTYNGVNYEWACINAPAFTVVDATHFTSNFTEPGNGLDMAGQQGGSGTNDLDDGEWANANTNTNAPANTNPPGIYDTSGHSGTSPWIFFHPSNGTVWFCSWEDTQSYTLPGPGLGSGRDNGCLAAPPPMPPSGGSVAISNQGGGNGSGFDDGDTLRATTSGWDNHGSAITGYTYTWERSDSFNGNGSCGNSGYSDVQGPTTNGNLTNDYATPNQSSGVGDSIRVTVTATNANGTSSSVSDCVVVYNEVSPGSGETITNGGTVDLNGGGTATVSSLTGSFGGTWLLGGDVSGNPSPDGVYRDSGSNPTNGSACGFQLSNGYSFSGTWHADTNEWDSSGHSGEYDYACFP